MGPWRPLGDPRAPRADFGTLQGRFWERRRSILEAMLAPKIDKIDVEIDSKNEHPFGITFGALRRPPGVDFGSILHRFWHHFWKLLAKRRICENRAAARAGARFSRFQGVQNALKNHQKKRLQHKVRPKTVLGPCGGRFSDDVGAMLDSKTDQKRNLKAFKINVESNLNFEAFLKRC